MDFLLECSRKIDWGDVAFSAQPWLLTIGGITAVILAAAGQIPKDSPLRQKLACLISGPVCLVLGFLSLMNEGGVVDGKIRLTILARRYGVLHPEMTVCSLGVGLLLTCLFSLGLGVFTYIQWQKRNKDRRGGSQ
jgi:hypothetical protein